MLYKVHLTNMWGGRIDCFLPLKPVTPNIASQRNSPGDNNNIYYTQTGFDRRDIYGNRVIGHWASFERSEAWLGSLKAQSSRSAVSWEGTAAWRATPIPYTILSYTTTITCSGSRVRLRIHVLHPPTAFQEIHTCIYKLYLTFVLFSHLK